MLLMHLGLAVVVKGGCTFKQYNCHGCACYKAVAVAVAAAGRWRLTLSFMGSLDRAQIRDQKLNI